jgi:hypothetical protein
MLEGARWVRVVPRDPRGQAWRPRIVRRQGRQLPLVLPRYVSVFMSHQGERYVLNENSYLSFRVKDSKDSCQTQYSRVYDCLQHNLNKNDATGEHAGACTGSLEDFAKCTKQWGGSSCGAVTSQRDGSQVHERFGVLLEYIERMGKRGVWEN